mgnify:CR=1 FL=1
MEVAKLIWKSWNEGKKLDPLSEKMKPNSRKKAYKIQEQIGGAEYKQHVSARVTKVYVHEKDLPKRRRKD